MLAHVRVFVCIGTYVRVSVNEQAWEKDASGGWGIHGPQPSRTNVWEGCKEGVEAYVDHAGTAPAQQLYAVQAFVSALEMKAAQPSQPSSRDVSSTCKHNAFPRAIANAWCINSCLEANKVYKLRTTPIETPSALLQQQNVTFLNPASTPAQGALGALSHSQDAPYEVGLEAQGRRRQRGGAVGEEVRPSYLCSKNVELLWHRLTAILQGK